MGSQNIEPAGGSEFFSRYALKLSPDDPEVKRIRAGFMQAGAEQKPKTRRKPFVGGERLCRASNISSPEIGQWLRVARSEVLFRWGEAMPSL